MIKENNSLVKEAKKTTLIAYLSTIKKDPNYIKDPISFSIVVDSLTKKINSL